MDSHLQVVEHEHRHAHVGVDAVHVRVDGSLGEEDVDGGNYGEEEGDDLPREVGPLGGEGQTARGAKRVRQLEETDKNNCLHSGLSMFGNGSELK